MTQEAGDRHGDASGRSLVALCADGHYALPACVTVLTLGLRWSGPGRLTVRCFVDSSFDGQHEASLLAVAAAVDIDAAVVRVDSVLDHIRNALPPVRFPHLSPMAWLRLYLPELLTDCATVLYVDCDVVVCASVSPLMRRPAGDVVLAAVRDYGIPELGTPHLADARIELAEHEAGLPYFNSGLLLVDIARWIDTGVREAAERAARSGPDSRGPLFGDQDALNSAIKGRFEVLDPRWNVTPLNTVRKVLDFEFQGGAYLPPAYLRHLEEHPWIMHYATRVKPWSDEFPGGRPRELWCAAAADVKAIAKTV